MNNVYDWINNVTKKEREVFHKFNINANDVYEPMYKFIITDWKEKYGYKLSWLDGALFFMHLKCRDTNGKFYCMSITYQWKDYKLHLFSIYHGVSKVRYSEGELTMRLSDYANEKLEATK